MLSVREYLPLKLTKECAFSDQFNFIEVPTILMDIFTWLGYLNSALNPLIYALAIKTFSATYSRMLRDARNYIRENVSESRFSNQHYGPYRFRCLAVNSCVDTARANVNVGRIEGKIWII